MSQSINSCEKTLKAGADLSAKQFYIVKLDANGDVVVATSALGLIVGVLQNKPLITEAALYRFGWTSKVILGGTVAIGDFVTTNASGAAIATTTDGDVVIGRALEAGVSGDVIEVQMGIQHLYIA